MVQNYAQNQPLPKVIAGLTYIDNVATEDGQLIPAYEMAEETAESWNAGARRDFLRRYIEEHGNPPEDFMAAYSEHQEHVRLMVEQCAKESGPLPALPII